MTREQLMAKIVEMVRVKQAVAEVDVHKLWPQALPRVAATEAELRGVEERLGEALDPQYRMFLSLAAGWPAFFHACDLFGPDELSGRGAGARGLELLSYLDPVALDDAKIARDDVRAIAVDRQDMDLFVIGRPSSSIPGVVIWFAAYEIERFATFDAFFLAMIEYNRLEVQALAKTN